VRVKHGYDALLLRLQTRLLLLWFYVLPSVIVGLAVLAPKEEVWEENHCGQK